MRSWRRWMVGAGRTVGLMAVLGLAWQVLLPAGTGDPPVSPGQLTEFVRLVEAGDPRGLIYSGYGNVFAVGRKLAREYEALFKPYARSEEKSIVTYVFVDQSGQVESYRVNLKVDRKRGTVVAYQALSEKYFRQRSQ